LRDELSGRGPCPEELQEIQRGADRAGRLTDQLLAFSRRQVVRPEPLDLNALVADLRSMLERLIGEGIRLETRTAPDLGLVHADRGHLEQVIMNLVVNARDALEGAGRLQISTENASIDEAAARAADFQLLPGEYVLLRVADEGHGMDEATRSRLFEPFFTTKEAGKGTGLGLATVYGSVRQASGHIGVETRPGRGTTFSIYLPRLRGAPAARSASREPAGEAAVGQGEMVLVAEDEAPVRTLIARVLERRGYRVLQAASAEEALELVAGHDGVIDLLVADLVMPGLSGRELADRLRDEYPDLSIILISGYTEDEVVRHGILTGERDFLPTPFTPATLARKVASVLQARPVNARRGSTEPADPRLGSRGARG
ncbi:MAG: ATP-binding protein, partial [Gemmatimonadota bacterium]